MNVLVISNNYIVVKEGRCYCDANFYHILYRFSYLGKISLCALAREEAGTYVELDFVPVENVCFVKKSRVFPHRCTWKQLRDSVKKNDLIVGYNPCVNAEAALWYAKRYGKKYMTYLVACVWGSLWHHSLMAKIAAPLRYVSVRLTTKYSDYALYVTETFLQGRYPNYGINAGCSDVQIAPCGNDVQKRRLGRLDLKKGTDTIKLVTAGSVEVEYKGQEYVIRALAELKKENKGNYRYYLVGGGDKSRLALLSEKLGVSENVMFLGLQPLDRIPEIFDEMDIYIQPSLTEGLPRSVVEAMSRGLVCLGSRTGGIPELLDNSYLFECKSVTGIKGRIVEVDTDLMKRLCIENMAKADMYSCEALDKRRKDFFDKIIADMDL